MASFERLNDSLREKGVMINAEGVMVRAPGFAGPQLISDEQIRYHNERAGQHDVEGRLKLQWVENLADVVATLCREGETAPLPFIAVFWIRLHGVVAELRSELQASFRAAGIDPATHVPNRGSLLDLGLETFRRIENVRRQLSEDELIYADYRRQTEGHPTQRSYSVRWSRANGGQVLDRRGIPALDREFTMAELDAALERVLRAHPSERAIALAFARRVSGVMPPLVQIMRYGNTPR